MFGDLTVIADGTIESVRSSLPDLRRALAERELPFVMHVTSGPDHATEVSRATLLDGGRYLVAVGNDGSIQAVLNGIFDDGRPIVDAPVLGVVGAGAGPDLLRTFGLPDDIDIDVMHLTGDNVYALDVMKISTGGDGPERTVRYAHGVAEVGFGGAVARTSARLPVGLGRARRFLGFWLTLVRWRPATVRVTSDMKSYEGPAQNVVIGNGQYANDGVRLSPRSFPGDGVLDTLVFRGPRSDALTMLPRMFRSGDHVPDPHITEMRAKIRVAVESDRPLPVVADGVNLGTTPATFQVVPKPILLKL